MARWPSCDAPLKDGDWTCGACGAPAAAAGVAAAPRPQEDYLPEYRAQPAAAGPAKSGSSGALRLVLIAAAIAIVAVVAVWFFALRGPTTTGDEFVGTWTLSTQSGIATTTIAKTGDVFAVTLSGSQQGQKVAVPAHLDGLDLVITLEDFSKLAGEADADRLKDALKALAGDFRMVFSSVDAGDLSLRIVGTSPSGQDYDQTYPLAKVTTAAP
jgi:hypothetical protein